MSSPVDMMIRLGDHLDKNRNSAFDLWTWLPSFKEAQKYHGDYASEHMPAEYDIMYEACRYIGDLRQGYPTKSDWYDCPCGEIHGEEDEVE